MSFFIDFIDTFLSLFLMLAWFLVPVGVPPAEEDARLLRAAPDRCLYFTTWSGMADADRTSSNTTERLLGEPDIRQFARGTMADVQKTVHKTAQGDPEAALAAEYLDWFINVLAVQPTAIYVTELEVHESGPGFRGAIVTKLGQSQRWAEASIGRLRTMIPHQFGVDVVPIKINDHSFDQIELGPAYPVTWGIADGYFIVGAGRQTVENTVQRMQRSDPPDWLIERRNQMPLKRRATFTYANLDLLFDAVEEFVGDDVELLGERPLGFARLKSYTSTSGLNDSEFVSRTCIEFHQNRTGVKQKPIDNRLVREDFAQIPANAMAASVFRVDPNDLLGGIRGVMSVDLPRGPAEFDEYFRLLGLGMGIRFEEDFVASLGDLWTIYASPRDGGLLTGWVLTVSLRDREKFLKTNRKFVTFLRQGFVGTQSQIQVTLFERTMIWTVLSDDWSALALSWTVTEDHLAIALFPQAIKAHLRREPTTANLADLPEIAKALEADPHPCFLAYTDTKSLMRSIYPLVQMAARLIIEELGEDGTHFRIALLPAADSIARHLNPNVMAASWADNQLVIDSRGSIPSGMVGVTVPVIAAYLLPAVESTRLSARHHQSMGNLSNIGNALRNYCGAHEAYPAAYISDEHGKPLLSWRVHILPYLGQKALYDQFRLDEPWSSKHNRRLIRLMPAIYRPAASGADPGKTNCLGVCGEGHLFVPPTPGDELPLKRHGTKMAAIKDGTSDTIAVVEVCDQRAVIWTKPDDFEPDRDDPVQGLTGLHGQTFHVLFCDGSVRPMSAAINRNTLRAMFTFSGGETIPGDPASRQRF